MLPKSLHAIVATVVNKGYPAAFNNEQDDSIFHTVTVGEYSIEGYSFCKDKLIEGIEPASLLCKLVKESGSPTMVDADDHILFSFFEQKENKNDGVYLIHTGKHDLDQLAEILKWSVIHPEYDEKAGECKFTDAFQFIRFYFLLGISF